MEWAADRNTNITLLSFSLMVSHSQSKAEFSGGLDYFLEVDAMVELILIKLHQQLQELGSLLCDRSEQGIQSSVNASR